MFDEEFEFDEVASFMSSVEDFQKVRRQREVEDEGEKVEVQKNYYKRRRLDAFFGRFLALYKALKRRQITEK